MANPQHIELIGQSIGSWNQHKQKINPKNSEVIY